MKRDDEAWTLPEAALFAFLESGPEGLTSEEAAKRRAANGANILRESGNRRNADLLLSQFASPITLLLLAAVALSFFLGDIQDAAIILTIVLAGAALGFFQERQASKVVSDLLAFVKVRADVLRDGELVSIPLEETVPGDVVRLAAGDMIPGDCRILEAKDMFVDEAPLTGESFPAEKHPVALREASGGASRRNALFMGSHMVSGSGTAIVVRTGRETEFGGIAERLKLRPPETEFELGLRKFGALLMEVTMILVFLIFAFNVAFHRPVLDSFLFALALAVGLTPQLLPVIVTVNLASGARRMTALKVIVKRLSAIENLGSMSVLCTDKTGTLTEGTLRIRGSAGPDGSEDPATLEFARLNAVFQTGFRNPVDEALLEGWNRDFAGYEKLDEIPYDFVRKRLSILVKHGEEHLLITKGAFSGILKVCGECDRDALEERFRAFSEQGFRVLGVATRRLEGNGILSKDDERDMTFSGFLLFDDPLKESVPETIRTLRDLGIRLKIVSGDSRLLVERIARSLGIAAPKVLRGEDLRSMSDAALVRLVPEVDVFAEVEPNQKERIILSLRKSGNAVGFLGDGINDAPALHAADVGISVSGAADVAREAADMVLLERDLRVLVNGIREGRRTFANTMKYVFMATSANFGNMFSMAGASLFLPFLPLLPKQILLTNILTDLPETAIAGDDVDVEMADHPRKWDIVMIRKFMIVFGLLSSVFDALTFVSLIGILHAGTDAFRTGWFVESVVSACCVTLVIRSRRPFFRSRPGKWLVVAIGATVLVASLLPLSPWADVLGFSAPTRNAYVLIAVLVTAYLLAAERLKTFFFRRMTERTQETKRATA